MLMKKGIFLELVEVLVVMQKQFLGMLQRYSLAKILKALWNSNLFEIQISRSSRLR